MLRNNTQITCKVKSSVAIKTQIQLEVNLHMQTFRNITLTNDEYFAFLSQTCKFKKRVNHCSPPQLDETFGIPVPMDQNSTVQKKILHPLIRAVTSYRIYFPHSFENFILLEIMNIPYVGGNCCQLFA